MIRRMACLGLLALMSCRPASTPVTLPEPRVAPTAPHQVGTASWYGEYFRGRLMANMEPFDPEALVAAHRTLPLGTRVQVKNLRTGLKTILTIKDRGPYIKGRILDVSHGAARLLGFEDDGLAQVEIRLL